MATKHNTMERIHILFVQRVPWGGGAERVIYDLAKGIDKRKFSIKILCLYPGGDLPKHLKTPEITYIRLDRGAGKFIACLSALLSALKIRFSILNRIRVRSRLRYMRQAWAEGCFLLYLQEKSCKCMGMGTHLRWRPPAVTSLKCEASPPNRPIDDWAQARLLADFIGKIHGPLVVVAVMEEAASVVRLALGMRPLSGRPYLLSTHAWESYYLPIMYGQRGYDLEREHHVFAEACQGAEAVLSPCDGCRDDLAAHFNSPPDRTLTMPNAVDIAAIQQAMLKPPEKNLPAQWGDLPFFVVAGRLDPQKRHDRILQACALLRRKTEEFRILFVGGGHLRKQVEAEITRLELSRYVQMIGQCANPFPYMRMALGLICASDSESFGLVLAEALVCGCVPISVDCPHGPRYVLDNGKGGFLVAESSEALAEAMFTALNEPDVVREKIAYGQTYIRRFDRPKIVRQWELLLAHVVGRHYNLE